MGFPAFHFAVLSVLEFLEISLSASSFAILSSTGSSLFMFKCERSVLFNDAVNW